MVRAGKLGVNRRLDEIPPEMDPLVGEVDEAAAAGLDGVRHALGFVAALLLLRQLEELQAGGDHTLEKSFRYPMIHQDEESPMSTGGVEVVEDFGALMLIGGGEEGEINDGE